MIQVENLIKYYGNHCVLRGISFQAKKGELVGVIGVNGAGKTTLFDIILGHKGYTSGKVFFHNQSLGKNPGLTKKMGSLLEPHFFSYLTVKENLLLLQEALGFKCKEEHQKIDFWLRRYQLKEKEDVKIKHLSFGQRQRVGLIQAMNHQADLLLLDEPFIGLDPYGKDLLKSDLKALTEKGTCILCSSHDLYDIGEIADKILYLKEGRFIYDGIFNQHKTYKIYVSGDLTSFPLKIENKAIHVEKKEKCVIVRESKLLSQVFFILNQSGLAIKDIDVHENSLYDFFRKGEL